MCRTDILPYLPNCYSQNASNAMLRHDMTKQACLSGCARSNMPSWLLSFCMFWQGEPGSDGTKGEKVSSVSFLCLRLNSYLFPQVLQHQNVSNLINVISFFPWLATCLTGSKNQMSMFWLFVQGSLWPTLNFPAPSVCFRESRVLRAPLSESFLTLSPVSWPKPNSKKARREKLELGRKERG